MNKQIDLRQKSLKRQPMQSKKFAYQAGKSTASALQHLERRIEKDAFGFDPIRDTTKMRQNET
jgi:hypothetical protein